MSSADNGWTSDRLLDGLLSPGFDEASCLSRYQSGLFRRVSSHRPSSDLVSRLREYEKLHILCGPNTAFFNQTLENLKHTRNASHSNGCKYIVWAALSGIGNKILTMTSAFAYALLTNRILLIQQEEDMADLFCEPFPNASWLLPPEFPVDLGNLSRNHPMRYGDIIEHDKDGISATDWSPAFVYLHLFHDYDANDKLFFCEEYQTPLANANWLIMKSDNYFMPSLFEIPSFEMELEKLFPDKEFVFHHLGRYLFHPSNQPWGLITRYYTAYMAQADETLGIQIRVLEEGTSLLPSVMNQILACTEREHLLPSLDHKKLVNYQPNKSSKSVLVTSLSQGYYEQMKDLYWTMPTTTGEVISFHQPSHEEIQQFGNNMHNVKAWSEIYLLSLCDKLVTTAWSTFGYVAHGLAGLRPWILLKSDNGSASETPCTRAISMEPCFHAPPNIRCKAKVAAETSDKASFVGPCEDRSWGTKLFGNLNS